MKEEQIVTSKTERQAQDSTGGGLKIVCVLLALVAVGLGAYLIVDKIGADDKTKCAANSSSESGGKSGSSGNVGFVYETDPIGTYLNYGQYIVTKDGDLYFAPSDEVSYSETDKIKVSYSVDDEIGTKGKFEFEPDGISYYAPGSEEGEKIKFEGYKLNVSDVQFVTEVGFGQQKIGISLAIVAKDGKMSILKTEESFGENTKLVLKKDVEENVASVGTAYHGSGDHVVVYYRDGSSKKLDDKIFE